MIGTTIFSGMLLASTVAGADVSYQDLSTAWST
jgi:hypothetical protein